MIGSLDETLDENAEALWVDEIRRRDEALRSGRATTRPVDEVLREARAFAMFEIVIHEGAEEDLNAAAQFYESREPDLGQQFLAQT